MCCSKRMVMLLMIKVFARGDWDSSLLAMM